MFTRLCDENLFIFVTRLVLIGMFHTLVRIDQETPLYRLVSKGSLNDYFVISSEGTRKMMASPEVIGYDCCDAVRRPMTAALKALEPDLRKATILTILRGGLNYPIEECCHDCGIRIDNINFLSCERVIRDHVIEGLEIKYEKLHPEKDCTMMIGDIVASGDTLRKCLLHAIDVFDRAGGSIRKIIFFTIGGTKAISLMEELTAQIRVKWPAFEGFECVFFEGAFTVYEDKGVTGVNIPMIDFGWKGGCIAPEFREYVLDYKYAPALLEKCIIYDGGARRYEIGDHFEEVIGYWNDLRLAAPAADFGAFLAEKVGYPLGTAYPEWLSLNGYSPDWNLEPLYNKEQRYLADLRTRSLKEICETRLKQLEKTIQQ